MAFNSIQYLLFFVTCVVVYFALPQRLRLNWLLIASLFFYASADPVLLAHLIAVISATYFLALRIGAETDKLAKKRWMIATVVALVGNLFVFKYTVFLSDNLRALAGSVGIPYPVPTFQMLLPLGVSFYTFSLISYVVDIYKGTIVAERRFNVFALYVSFFPKDRRRSDRAREDADPAVRRAADL